MFSYCQIAQKPIVPPVKATVNIAGLTERLHCTMSFYWSPAIRLIFLAYFLIFLLPKPLLGINIDVIWLIIDFWSFPRPVVANLEAQNPQNSS